MTFSGWVLEIKFSSKKIFQLRKHHVQGSGKLELGFTIPKLFLTSPINKWIKQSIILNWLPPSPLFEQEIHIQAPFLSKKRSIFTCHNQTIKTWQRTPLDPIYGLLLGCCTVFARSAFCFLLLFSLRASSLFLGFGQLSHSALGHDCALCSSHKSPKQDSLATCSWFLGTLLVDSGLFPWKIQAKTQKVPKILFKVKILQDYSTNKLTAWCSKDVT